MKTIVSPRERVAKVWGKQKIHPESAYRLMKYTIRADAEEGVLLHNVVTGEMVLLSQEEARCLTGSPVAYTPILDDLIVHFFLVPVEYDEKSSVEKIRKLLRMLYRTKDITGYTILPTTGCNARCFYCYEKGIPAHSMTGETAQKLVSFISRHCGQKRRVSINWFGGEPLVGAKRIDEICAGLEREGVSFSSSMISNGFLFDRELVQRAKEVWKLNSIQITLDGTEAVYNKTKDYIIPGESPFRKVLGNIDLLLEAGIRVSIRINLGPHNWEDLQKLCELLIARYTGKQHFSVNIALLFDGIDYQFEESAQASEQELCRKKDRLENLLLEAGLLSQGQAGLPALKTNACMADGDGGVLINPDGGIGKCDHYIFEELIGQVGSDTLDSKAADSWKQPRWIPQCDDCPLFPSCLKSAKCPGLKCVEAERRKSLELHRLHMAERLHTAAETAEAEENPTENPCA